MKSKEEAISEYKAKYDKYLTVGELASYEEGFNHGLEYASQFRCISVDEEVEKLMNISRRIRQIGNAVNESVLHGYATEIAAVCVRLLADDTAHPKIVQSVYNPLQKP